MEAEPVVNQENEPFAGQDIAEVALQHVRLNGVHADQTIGETENDEQYDRIGDEMEVDETAAQRRHRYQNSEQDEVSDPDEWAEVHFGGMDGDNHQRMVAFSDANQLRLRRAMQTET